MCSLLRLGSAGRQTAGAGGGSEGRRDRPLNESQGLLLGPNLLECLRTDPPLGEDVVPDRPLDGRLDGDLAGHVGGRLESIRAHISPARADMDVGGCASALFEHEDEVVTVGAEKDAQAPRGWWLGW